VHAIQELTFGSPFAVNGGKLPIRVLIVGPFGLSGAKKRDVKLATARPKLHCFLIAGEATPLHVDGG